MKITHCTFGLLDISHLLSCFYPNTVSRPPGLKTLECDSSRLTVVCRPLDSERRVVATTYVVDELFEYRPHAQQCCRCTLYADDVYTALQLPRKPLADFRFVTLFPAYNTYMYVCIHTFYCTMQFISCMSVVFKQ